jgi:hypothetical protein
MKINEKHLNYDLIARKILGKITNYGRSDASIGSSARSYYETEVNGFVKGCKYMHSLLNPKKRR